MKKEGGERGNGKKRRRKKRKNLTLLALLRGQRAPSFRGSIASFTLLRPHYRGHHTNICLCVTRGRLESVRASSGKQDPIFAFFRRRRFLSNAFGRSRRLAPKKKRPRRLSLRAPPKAPNCAYLVSIAAGLLVPHLLSCFVHDLGQLKL
jgi:hypothetical protein